MHQEKGLTVHSIAQLPSFYQKKARKAFSPGTSSEETGRLHSRNWRWKNGENEMIAIAIRRRSRYNKSTSSQRSGFCPASHPWIRNRETWKRNRSCRAPIRKVCYKQTFSTRDFQDDFLELPSGPDEKSFLVSFKFIASSSLPEPV